MSRVVLRVLIILIAAFGIASVDGMSRGLEMPPEVDTTRVPTVRKAQKEESHIPKAENGTEDAVAADSEGDTKQGDGEFEAKGNGDLANEEIDSSDEDVEEDDFTAELLNELLYSGSAMVIDARLLDEYTAGHIPTAFHLPIDAFNKGIPEVMHLLLDIQASDPEMQFIVYCDGGDCHASNIVGTKLQQFGITNVFVFDGGYPAWVNAGYDIEQGEPFI